LLNKKPLGAFNPVIKGEMYGTMEDGYDDVPLDLRT
jgi:hypothetical protein